MPGRSQEEKGAYYDVQVQSLADIKKSFAETREKFREFLDPNLIFKLEVTQRVTEDRFREELSRMEIDVLSPSPDKTGYWVVFAEDPEVTRFETKLQAYAETSSYRFFNAVGDLVEIPPQEKIGERLRTEGLTPDEIAFLDVEIWRMENTRLNRFIAELERWLSSKGGRVSDRLIRTSFCLLRVQVSGNILQEVLQLREVALVDRPPKPYIQDGLLRMSLETMEVGDTPPEDATAIALLDSGVLSGHPLLQNAIGDEIAIATKWSDKIKSDKPTDDVGHGTQVAGIALYGDLKECIRSRVFNPTVWLLSAKVLYREENPITGEIRATYDEEELLEHQLEESVRQLIESYPNCRVVNLSLGNEDRRMFQGKRQFNLAALVDDLAKELNAVFVVSAGNFGGYAHAGFPDNYPSYLLNETEDVKIVDPASAALGLTVGSVTQEYGPSPRFMSDALFSPANTGFPSPFTSVGPGYQGMIKPELVEEGGNILEDHRTGLQDIGGQLVTLNPNWQVDGKLFWVNHGTSFTAPRVAHYAATLFNQFRNASANLVKALLIASAEIPQCRPPGRLSELKLGSSDSDFAELASVYGYGKPNLERARFSTDQRVFLLRENQIGLDAVHVYYFYLPVEFVYTRGLKKIAVTLVYDPPTNKNRLDYLGCTMEFSLFKNMNVEDVVRAYKAIAAGESTEEELPETFKIARLDLQPGVRLRSKGVHQKSVVEYTSTPQIDPDKPLVLPVLCRKRWIQKESYVQDYAVVVTIEHSMKIDLFNLVRVRNQERAQVTLLG